MANPLFKESQQNDFMSKFNQFKSNPTQFLASNNVNIPPQFANDPRGAVQYMLNSGKMSQSQLNSLTQMAQRMGIKL